MQWLAQHGTKVYRNQEAECDDETLIVMVRSLTLKPIRLHLMGALNDLESSMSINQVARKARDHCGQSSLTSLTPIST